MRLRQSGCSLAGRRRPGSRGTAAGSMVAMVLLVAGMALGAAGDLDPTFGDGGIVKFDPQAPANGEGRAVAVQPDGKLVVAGTPQFLVGGGGDYDLGVWRFEANGDLDL